MNVDERFRSLKSSLKSEMGSSEADLLDDLLKVHKEMLQGQPITLTIEQVEKIVEKLRDYQIEIFDMENFNIRKGLDESTIDTEYLTEKINEGLE